MSPVPLHLKHKPIFAVEDYEMIDGRYAGETDALGLSLGLPQWDMTDGISLKVWRHTGEKWTRQSEELPAHRGLDLTLLFLLALKARHDGSRDATAKCGDFKMEARLVFEGRTSKESEEILNALSAYLEKDMQFLEPRLRAISEILKKLGY